MRATESAAPAAESPDALRFLHRLRLSDATIEHFELGAIAAEEGTTPRLHIPLRAASGAPDGHYTRALHDSASCGACGETVSAAQVADRRRLGEADWAKCPFCAAPKKKAKVSWLLTQHPKYLQFGGLMSEMYHAHGAAQALGDTDARRRAQRAPTVVLCDGFTDTWAIYEAGQRTVMAWRRTGPSPAQIREVEQIARWHEVSRPGEIVHHPIVIAADSDAAGRAAAAKTRDALRALGVAAVRVVSDYGPDARCPSEVLARQGAVALAEMIASA